MKNTKIIKRKRRVKNEEIKNKPKPETIKKKKLNIKEVKEETAANKLLRMINSKHLYTYAINKILKCDSDTLHELKNEILPFLFNKLMVEESNLIYKILHRLFIVYDDKKMLFKYLKSFEYSNNELIDKIVRIVLKINPGLFSENKNEIFHLITNDRLKNELLKTECVDNLQIINK
ncbi:hypothetical protein TUBRATIS_10560 [Tubulinosema ratisbonensis]|uniref:Uncharacterized protein n=1 Tax=Tubulinosema ratisbonensis TaxID=291195 RepID=A0A437AMK5_9MICR|nr:hypothetical protein TUBRATIS_10560 [Tubulinosema ratisbonensis]